MENQINNINNLRDLFITECRELFSTNEQELREMNLILRESTSHKLKAIIEQQIERTKIQQHRMKDIFQKMNEIPEGKNCLTTEGILKQTREHILAAKENNVRDACIISSLQKLNHRKITGFGSAAAYARELEKDHAARILRDTLAEEKEINNQLTDLAESEINKMARMTLLA